MMTKTDHVAYWMATADDNWRELHNMMQAGDYLPALFWAHLCIEKLSKALWVKENEANIPPRIHNIISLLRDTSYRLTPEQTTLATQLNNFQLDGRYPDHHRRMQRMATASFTTSLLAEIAALRQCLLAMLP
jgi:HEPN domain-containing protein